MRQRDTHSDLPLFRWTPPTADVIPFPAIKRVGKIRRTAELIYYGTDKAAAAHWRRAREDLCRQMERVGISADRIDAEVRALLDAIEGEVTVDAMVARSAGLTEAMLLDGRPEPPGGIPHAKAGRLEPQPVRGHPGEVARQSARPALVQDRRACLLPRS